MGLKTIINLSNKSTDIQDHFEAKFCKLLKIKYITFYTIGPEYQFEEAYKALLECEKPVLVHCEGGKDRTGGLIAYYKRFYLNKKDYQLQIIL